MPHDPESADHAGDDYEENDPYSCPVCGSAYVGFLCEECGYEDYADYDDDDYDENDDDEYYAWGDDEEQYPEDDFTEYGGGV